MIQAFADVHMRAVIRLEANRLLESLSRQVDECQSRAFDVSVGGANIRLSRPALSPRYTPRIMVDDNRVKPRNSPGG